MNITNIPAPRVPFIDERTGLMAREWYRFFLNLFVLTGSGNNTLTVGTNDVLDMAGMNWLNASTASGLGWSNGTYTLAASEGRHQLVVAGDAAASPRRARRS